MINRRVYDITIGVGWGMVTTGVSLFDYRVGLIVGGVLCIALAIYPTMRKI